MAEPTREDAQLMLQIAQWGTGLGVNDALPKIFADDFDPKQVDAMEDNAVRTILTFGETIGTLVKRDLLSRELVDDWLWIDGIWARVGPAAVRQRHKHDEPRLYENFEALTSDQVPDVEATAKEAEEEEREAKEEEERKAKEEEERKAKEEEEKERESSNEEDGDKDESEDDEEG